MRNMSSAGHVHLWRAEKTEFHLENLKKGDQSVDTKSSIILKRILERERDVRTWTALIWVMIVSCNLLLTQFTSGLRKCREFRSLVSGFKLQEMCYTIYLRCLVSLKTVHRPKLILSYLIILFYLAVSRGFYL
jgi:hypothetical protein